MQPLVDKNILYMSKTENPSIYPYLVAEFIENDANGWTIEAIKFITREELKELKSSHTRKQELEKIVAEARKNELHIFSFLPDLNHPEWVLEINLSQETQKLISPIIRDIISIYTLRNWIEAAEKFQNLLLGQQNEIPKLIIHYKKNKDGNGYFIKKIFLQETQTTLN